MDASTPKLLSALSTTVVLIKAGNTKLSWGTFYNSGNALAFVQLFDAVQASDVTLGTTVPKMVVPVAAGASASFNIGGAGFQLGLCVAAATTALGSAAPNAAQIVNLGFR